MHFVKELREGERVIEHYLCKKKENRESKAGKAFLSLKLQDKTGIIDAKVWDLSNDIQPFDEGEMIKIDGSIIIFQNDLQIKVAKLRRSREGEYVPEDYIPSTTKDISEMYSQIVEMIKGVKDPHIKTLLENIIIKDEIGAEAFKNHCAAVNMHHAFKGGLIEHTLSVAEICMSLGKRYKYVNLDILLAGALLHDFGKIFEISPLPHSEYTDDGQMLGHIIMCVEIISAEVNKIEDFPHELASLIKHCILAHHGEFEFGSPKLPATPEAMLLHFADNIDAKLTTFSDIIEKDANQGLWSNYNKALGRYIRKPSKR